MQQEHGNHAEKSGMERSSTAGAVLWVWLFTAFPFVLQAAEVGALTPKIECPESGFFPVLYPKTVLFATASKDGKV